MPLFAASFSTHHPLHKSPGQNLYTLPYFCDPTELPDALPTLNEIERASVSLPSIRNPDLDRIVLAKGRFVVKYGVHVSENEGHALLFLQNHAFIPSPKLYAMYREANKLYLVMSRMPGIQLSSVWDDLSEEEKLDILVQLRATWDYMRSIPSPPTFSGLDGGPLRHRFFRVLEPDPRITGPFDTEEALNQALALRSRKNWEGHQRRPRTPEFFARNLGKALVGHTIVLTHGDPQRKNILVEQLSTGDAGEARRFRVSAVLDWEEAGWYPSYWEYAACFVDFEWYDDWPEKIEQIIDPYPLEAAMLRVVRQDLDY
ncbi:phosphotransferase family protein [Xylaria grammica]|nr:phosphotransferase family protein [Xylaria grammica]